MINFTAYGISSNFSPAGKKHVTSTLLQFRTSSISLGRKHAFDQSMLS